MLDPLGLVSVEVVIGDDRTVGCSRLDFVGVNPLAGDEFMGLAVAVDVGPD